MQAVSTRPGRTGELLGCGGACEGVRACVEEPEVFLVKEFLAARDGFLYCQGLGWPSFNLPALSTPVSELLVRVLGCVQVAKMFLHHGQMICSCVLTPRSAKGLSLLAD